MFGGACLYLCDSPILMKAGNSISLIERLSAYLILLATFFFFFAGD